jgi:hypothetical protein
LVRPVTTDPARSMSTSSAPVLGSSTTDTGSVIGVPRCVEGGCQRMGRCDDRHSCVSFDDPRISVCGAKMAGRLGTPLGPLLAHHGLKHHLSPRAKAPLDCSHLFPMRFRTVLACGEGCGA